MHLRLLIFLALLGLLPACSHLHKSSADDPSAAETLQALVNTYGDLVQQERQLGNLESGRIKDEELEKGYTIEVATQGSLLERAAAGFYDRVSALPAEQKQALRQHLLPLLSSAGLSLHGVKALQLVYSDDELIALLSDGRAVPTPAWQTWRTVATGSYGIQSPRLIRAAQAALALMNAGLDPAALLRPGVR